MVTIGVYITAAICVCTCICNSMLICGIWDKEHVSGIGLRSEKARDKVLCYFTVSTGNHKCCLSQMPQ